MTISLVAYDVWRTLLLPNKAYTQARAELILRTAGWAGDTAEGAAIIAAASKALDRQMNATGVQYGFEPRVEAAVRQLVLSPLDAVQMQSLAEAALRLHLEMPPTLIDPELPAVFAALRTAGITIAVVSNTGFTNGRVISAILPRLGLPLDVEVYSDQQGIAKPDAAIFRRLLELSGHGASQAVFIGDTYDADVQGATGAGLAALHYTPEAATGPQALGRHRDLLSHPLLHGTGVQPLALA